MMAKRNSKQGIDPLIEESEVLRALAGIVDPRFGFGAETCTAHGFRSGDPRSRGSGNPRRRRRCRPGWQAFAGLLTDAKEFRGSQPSL
jgi:hypothetical protein